MDGAVLDMKRIANRDWRGQREERRTSALPDLVRSPPGVSSAPGLLGLIEGGAAPEPAPPAPRPCPNEDILREQEMADRIDRAMMQNAIARKRQALANQASRDVRTNLANAQKLKRLGDAARQLEDQSNG